MSHSLLTSNISKLNKNPDTTTINPYNEKDIGTGPTACAFCQGTIKFWRLFVGLKNGQIEPIMGISNVTVTSIARNLSKLKRSNTIGGIELTRSENPDSNHPDTCIPHLYYPYRLLSIVFKSQSIVSPFYYPKSGMSKNTKEGTLNSHKYKISQRN
ncbi:hypothetical protein HZS_6727 [Henneguya salminicola]|nr:hypothetical protein HZS_6727 [Henneguya salminicola]